MKKFVLSTALAAVLSFAALPVKADCNFLNDNCALNLQGNVFAVQNSQAAQFNFHDDVGGNLSGSVTNSALAVGNSALIDQTHVGGFGDDNIAASVQLNLFAVQNAQALQVNAHDDVSGNLSGAVANSAAAVGNAVSITQLNQ